MAFRSGLFNSVNGDRKYQAAHFAEYFATFIGNGVFPNPSNGLQVYAKENMTVTIKSGKAWINGYYFVNDSDCDLKIGNADGVLKRKDRIVLRFDTSTRLITPEIRKGAFSASPTVPAIQRDADAYELALATVSIDKGTVALTQSAITDERLNTTVCGIVHGVVDQVDTVTLFNQYQTWYAEKMEQYNTLMTNAETSFNNQLQAQQTAFDSQSAANQNAFDTQFENNQTIFEKQTVTNQQTFDEWLTAVQTILDGDVAGNLLNLINNNAGSLAEHKSDSVTHITSAERMSWNEKIDNSQKGISGGVAKQDDLIGHINNSALHPVHSIVVGDTVLFSSSKSASKKNTVYEKIRSIKITKDGSYRVSYNMSNNFSYGGNVYSKLYKNGVAIGVEHSNSSGTSTFTEDIAGLKVGDSLELWVNSGNNTATNSVFKLCGTVVIDVAKEG